MAILSPAMNVVAGGPVVASKRSRATNPRPLPPPTFEQMSWIWEYSRPTERDLMTSQILKELAIMRGVEVQRLVISP
jgi:hypothetical protein